MKTLFASLLLMTLPLPAPPAPARQHGPTSATPAQQAIRHPFACADYSLGKVFLVSAEGQMQWEYPATHCNDVWVLPNGNTVMSDWRGHGQLGKGPDLIEVTPDKRVVWTFAGHTKMKTVSSVQLLDVPGDVTRGEILH